MTTAEKVDNQDEIHDDRDFDVQPKGKKNPNYFMFTRRDMSTCKTVYFV